MLDKEELKKYIADNYEFLFGNDKSVVVMRCTAEPFFYVSRVPKLGLTTYGKTPEEATEKLVRMFSSFVNTYSKMPYKDEDQ